MKNAVRLIAAVLAAMMMLIMPVSCGKKTTEAGATDTTGKTDGTEETANTFGLGDRVFDFDIGEYVKLPDISTLKIKKSELEDSVNAVIENLLEEYKREREKTETETVEEGDTVYLYYKGALIVFEGDVSVTAGESGFAELDNEIIGKEFGAGKLSLTLTLGGEFSYPELFGEDTTGLEAELAGKTVTAELVCAGKTGAVTEGETLAGRLTVTYVFGGGTYDETSAAELVKTAEEHKGFGLAIGSHSFIDGFEDGMIGMSVKNGTKKVLHIAFPDPYLNNTAYSGKKVDFEVTVLSATGYTSLDLSKKEDFDYLKERMTEDYGKGSFEYENREELSADLTKSYKQGMVTDAFVNAGELIKEEENTLDEYFKMVKDYYLNLFSAEYYSYTGMMPDEETISATFFGGRMDEELRAVAVNEMKCDLMHFLVAEEQGLDTVTKEEYDKYLEDLAAEYLKHAETDEEKAEITPENLEKELGGIKAIKKQIIYERASDWLCEHIGYEDEC